MWGKSEGEQQGGGGKWEAFVLCLTLTAECCLAGRPASRPVEESSSQSVTSPTLQSLRRDIQISFCRSQIPTSLLRRLPLDPHMSV